MTAGVVDSGRVGLAEEPVTGSADTASVAGEALREITRGGLAGLVVGILLGGVGGRLVMRLAALLVPTAAGSATENGNVIGAITLDGTLALILFVGLFFGAVAGSVWVVVSPWLPAKPGLRAALAALIAVALGTAGLIDHRNPDFVILGRDPIVIASLVVLVALFGPALVLAERWFDRRLPHPRSGDTGILAGYALVTGLGTLLTALLILPLFLGSALALSGVALVVVGLSTLASWSLRIQRRPERPTALVLAARAGLAVATLAGLVVAIREIGGALGPL